MKKPLKYFVKLLFVIILPVIVSIVAIGLLISNYSSVIPLFTPLEIGFIITLFTCTLLNAIFYSSIMSQTKLLPGLKFEFMPMIGLGIGIDVRVQTLIIMIPLCAIEIRFKK